MTVAICQTCGYHVSDVEGDVEALFERHVRLKHPIPTAEKATSEQLARGKRNMNRRLARMTRDWPKDWL